MVIWRVLWVPNPLIGCGGVAVMSGWRECGMLIGEGRCERAEGDSFAHFYKIKGAIFELKVFNYLYIGE